MSATIELATVRFAKALREKLALDLARSCALACVRSGCDSLSEVLLDVEVWAGPRYLKLIVEQPDEVDGTSRRTYAFVDRSTGAVLQPRSYKRPYKKPSGHVLDDTGGLAYCGSRGPAGSEQTALEDRKKWSELVQEAKARP